MPVLHAAAIAVGARVVPHRVLLAGLATTGAVTAYARSIFNTRFLSLLTGLVLLVLYGFVFINLQLQNYALLVDSIALFAALTLTMYLTRNINQ